MSWTLGKNEQITKNEMGVQIQKNKMSHICQGTDGVYKYRLMS